MENIDKLQAPVSWKLPVGVTERVAPHLILKIFMALMANADEGRRWKSAVKLQGQWRVRNARIAKREEHERARREGDILGLAMRMRRDRTLKMCVWALRITPCARRIQNGWRCLLARRSYNAVREKQRAATAMMRRSFRGPAAVCLQKWRECRWDAIKARHAAACKIQGLYRAALPQLPVTLLNAVISTAKLADVTAVRTALMICSCTGSSSWSLHEQIVSITTSIMARRTFPTWTNGISRPLFAFTIIINTITSLAV